MEIQERLEKVEKILTVARKGWILIEGLRDKNALEKLRFDKSRIFTMSGNLKLSCKYLAEKPGVVMVFVMTDLDRRGNELAKNSMNELESMSIKADLETRNKLAHLLRIRNFEDAKKAYDRLIRDVDEFK